MSSALFELTNTSPSSAAGISADLSSKAPLLPCPVLPHRRSHRTGVHSQGPGTKESRNLVDRRVSCEQSKSVMEKRLAMDSPHPPLSQFCGKSVRS